MVGGMSVGREKKRYVFQNQSKTVHSNSFSLDLSETDLIADNGKQTPGRVEVSKVAPRQGDRFLVLKHVCNGTCLP